MADPGSEYRHAKEAVVVHVGRWAAAETAVVEWLKTKRGVPSHLLYDPETGDPRDPELAALLEAEAQAERDVTWCKALVVACGEVVKGRSFDEVLASQGPRPTVADVLRKD